MKISLAAFACLALLSAPCFAQFSSLPQNANPGVFLPPQGVVGNPTNMPVVPGSFGNGLNGSGFVPGGQNMGGQGMSVNQYLGMRYLQGLAGRRSSGPHYGVANPFVTPNDPYNAAFQQQMQQQPQTSLKPPKSVPIKMTAEERRAEAKRLAEERKTRAAQLAAERKAKAAQKKPIAQKDN